MKKFLLAITQILLLSAFYFAQTDEYSKGEFFAGYSSSSDLLDDSLSHTQRGFNVAVVRNVHKYIGIKGDVSGTYEMLNEDYYYPANPFVRTETKALESIYSATIGVQFKDNTKDRLLKPFGHFLIGYGKDQFKYKPACPSDAYCSLNGAGAEGVSVVIGGGLDIRVNKRIDIRAIQLDLNPIISTANRYGNYFNGRFSAGVVFKF